MLLSEDYVCCRGNTWNVACRRLEYRLRMTWEDLHGCTCCRLMGATPAQVSRIPQKTAGKLSEWLYSLHLKVYLTESKGFVWMKLLPFPLLLFCLIRWLSLRRLSWLCLSNLHSCVESKIWIGLLSWLHNKIVGFFIIIIFSLVLFSAAIPVPFFSYIWFLYFC